MRTARWCLWVWLGVLGGAAFARGATWDEWRGPKADATVSAEFVSGWAMDPSQTSWIYKALPFNRGYDGDLVFTLNEGASLPPGPLSVLIWHAGVPDKRMNWPKNPAKIDTDSFVLDILPGVPIGPTFQEERWEVEPQFPLRVPVVRPRNSHIPSKRDLYHPALWGGYQVTDAQGQELCRGRLPPRMQVESHRVLLGAGPDDAVIKEMLQNISTLDRVHALPDAMEAYLQVQGIWMTESLWETLKGREAILRRLLLSGIQLVGEKEMVEQMRTTLGTGVDGRVLLGVVHQSKSLDRLSSLQHLKIHYDHNEDDDRKWEREESLFDNEVDLFKPDQWRFALWTWLGWAVFAGGIMVVLAVMFWRRRGERRVAVWWLLPAWSVACALGIWGGGKFWLNRQPRADVTEYRLMVSGWEEMRCHVVASGMTFGHGRTEWTMPTNAVVLVPSSPRLDGIWARLDRVLSPDEQRWTFPRQPAGEIVLCEAGWFEPSRSPVVLEGERGDRRSVQATEDLERVYVFAEGVWRDLGAMKAGERQRPLEVDPRPKNGLSGLPKALHAVADRWHLQEGCQDPTHDHPPREAKVPEHDWLVVAWQADTPARVRPVGEDWEVKSRTLWMEQWK